MKVLHTSSGNCVKGDPKQRHKLSWKLGKRQNISIFWLQNLHCCYIYKYSCNKSTVLLAVFNLNSSRHSWAMLVHFLPAKIRKRLSHDVTYIYSSATHASPIYVVAGKVCLTQNGCAHGCAFAAFKLWSLTSNAKTPLADLEKCRKQWSSHFE